MRSHTLSGLSWLERHRIATRNAVRAWAASTVVALLLAPYAFIIAFDLIVHGLLRWSWSPRWMGKLAALLPGGGWLRGYINDLDSPAPAIGLVVLTLCAVLISVMSRHTYLSKRAELRRAEKELRHQSLVDDIRRARDVR